MLRLVAWAAVLGLAGCATTTPGARPHDMSAGAHEREARAHEHEAGAHAARYDPLDLGGREERCRAAMTNATNQTHTGEGCWSSLMSPTDVHLSHAATHRAAAAKHRAASAALRDAEARTCEGLAQYDRDLSPFEHTEDIAAVAPLPAPGDLGGEKPVGAVVTFKPVPGISPAWLQRVVDCHLARNAALGHDVPEMPDCPLVPKGASATVVSAGKALTVEIRADNPAAAAEILARARRLLSSSTKAAEQ